MLIGSILFMVLAIIVYLIYHLKVSTLKENKSKHDYINANEIRWYKFVFFLFGLAIACVISLYGREDFNDFGVWFFVRCFFSIAGATLVTYVASLVLDYYYPTQLNYKLRKLRYSPRISSTGSKMKLLSEDEEDVHLDEGMQAEENIFSVDYDVWVDEKTTEIKIEKYQGHLIALQCNNCGFYTMKVHHEEVVVKNDDGSPKEILKHYRCTYCKNVRATQFSINRKEKDDYKLAKPKFTRSTRNVELIKIDVHSVLGAKKTFEFQSVEEAEKFLKEFDFDKVS